MELDGVRQKGVFLASECAPAGPKVWLAMVSRKRNLLRLPFSFLLVCAALVAFAPAKLVAQDAELEALASRVGKSITRKKRSKVLVADFVGPKGQVNELGRELAAQLSSALEKADTSLRLLPRNNLRVSLAGAQVGGAWGQPQTESLVYEFGRLAEAEIVVTGEMKPKGGRLDLRVRIWDIPPGRKESGVIHFRQASQLAEEKAQIPLTQALEASLAKPLPPSRPGEIRLTAGLKASLAGPEGEQEWPEGRSEPIPSAPAPSLPGPVYKPGQAGIGYPECLWCPEPLYSREARKKKYEGTVELEVTITAEGRAVEITLIKAAGHGLDEKAIEALRSWKFKPALGPDGRPVPVRVPVEVTFRLLD